MKENNSIGIMPRIDERLKALGMPMVRFIELMGIDSQTITNWRNRGFPGNSLVKAADILGMSVDELATGSISRFRVRTDIPEYTFENAPPCEHDGQYLLRVEGGMLPDYPKTVLFEAVPYDKNAKQFGTYSLCVKDGRRFFCLQKGPAAHRTHIQELVGGRTVDSPEFYHKYQDVEILCATFEAVRNHNLWSGD